MRLVGHVPSYGWCSCEKDLPRVVGSVYQRALAHQAGVVALAYVGGSDQVVVVFEEKSLSEMQVTTADSA